MTKAKVGKAQSSIPALELTKPNVALIGFAGTSRHLAPYDDQTWECWSLNEAHRQPWMKRLTRWFQIHQKWDWQKMNNESYREHREWLTKDHPFPIYMLEKYSEVPSSVRYPLEDVIAKLVPNVKRGDAVNEYFTSSFAWMCALALYLGPPKKIGVWGFEMATDT